MKRQGGLLRSIHLEASKGPGIQMNTANFCKTICDKLITGPSDNWARQGDIGSWLHYIVTSGLK